MAKNQVRVKAVNYVETDPFLVIPRETQDDQLGQAKITELNYYRPGALTSVIMKCFERLGKDHFTFTLPATLDPPQFAYRPNRSTDNAIPNTLHTALSHLDIVPSKLIIKLEALGFNPALCNWVLDFLTGRPPGGEGRKQHLHFADP
jgi:hypothetical protein